MKHFGIVSVFFLAILVASAQTNLIYAASTNMSAPREMTLQDCIAEALQHNFDLQIQRLSPIQSLYNLRGDYGAYDPSFSASATHQWSKDALGTDGYTNFPGTNFFLYPRETSKQNDFSSDLGGSLPWGMDYDLIANAHQNYGTKFSGSSNLVSTFSRSTSSSVEADLTQHLLKDFWIDSSRLSIRLDKISLKSSELDVRKQFIATVTSVANAYYELIYARENLKVQQEALTLARTQLDQDQQRMQIGTLAQLSVQQDESQVAQFQATVISAQSTLNTDENNLKDLITDAYSQWHNVDVRPSEPLSAPVEIFDLQDSWSKGMTLRPELVQARLAVEAQGIRLKFDRNQLFPSLDLVGTYGFNGAAGNYDGAFDEVGRGDRPYYSIGAKFSIPLGNVSARNSLKSAKISEKQLLLQLKQLEQGILVGIDNSVKQAQSAYQSVEATKQARIYAEAALDAEQKTYAVGKATTFEVLQYQNKLTDARSQEIRALANYNESLAALAAAEGTTLDRFRVDLQITRNENVTAASW